LGSPQAFYGRYKYVYKNHLQWGITADKDAGEEFFSGNNATGFDFYSAHLRLSDIGILKNLIIGDFSAQFGQGLALWQGGFMSKSSDALGISKRGAGFKAYTGADENNFFRGIALQLNIKRWIVGAFISRKAIDANLDSTGVFSTQYTTGLHNTVKTMQDKDALQETVTGMNISRRFKTLVWGATALWHHWDGDFQKDVKPYNMFELNRNSNANVSTDFRWYIQKFHFFGEYGMSQNTAGAVLLGSAVDVANSLQFSILYRNYAVNYQALYSNPFSEGGKSANENGIYFGANIAPHPQIKTSVYFDVYHFPWLKYKAHAPSKGLDALLQIDYTPQALFRMYWRIKYDTKEENVPNENIPLKSTDNIEKIQLRYNISYNFGDGLSGQSRAEMAFYKAGEAGNREKGFLAFQDIKYTFARPQLNFSVRYALFNTDSYNTRLYAYESDVLYGFSIPAYYGNASRWYFNIQYAPHSKLTIWLRIAQTYYFDRTSIGSGLNLNETPHQTEIKLQARIKI
jgi:hypothetical protein